MPDPSPRTWDSTCGDCAHFVLDACAAGRHTTGDADCIAAVCEAFLPKEKEEEARASPS